MFDAKEIIHEKCKRYKGMCKNQNKPCGLITQLCLEIYILRVCTYI